MGINLKLPIMMFLIFIVLIKTGETTNQIQPPNIKKIVDTFDRFIDISHGHTVEISFPNHGYIAGLSVKERKNDPKMNINTAYVQKYDQFRKMSSCEIIDPQISMNKTIVLPLEDRVILSYLDKISKVLLLMTDKNFLLYRTIQKNDYNFTMIKKLPLIQSFKGHKITFLRLYQAKVYVTDGHSIYQFVKFHTPQQADLLFIANFTGAQIEGEETVNLEKIITSGDTEVIFLYDRLFIVYELNTASNEFKLLQKYNSTQLYSLSNTGFFVDIIEQNGNIYLLNNQIGIIQVPNYHPNSLNKKTMKLHRIEYGELLKFKKFGQVFEIICRYKRKRFVAEFIKFPTKEELVLNRFYDKVEDVHDVAMINQHLHIYGSDEVHLYGPAVNRKILLDYKQYPYIFSSHGIQTFIILSSSEIVHSNIQLIGINQRSLNILQMKTQQLSIKCQPKTDVQLKISAITSCCNDIKNCQVTSLCEEIENVSINIKNMRSLSQAIMIMIGIIIILIIIFVGFYGYCYKKAGMIKNQMNRMLEQINAKRKKNQPQPEVQLNEEDNPQLNQPSNQSFNSKKIKNQQN